jgi:4-hydroxybenzoate polyprenyltransferase
MKCSNRPNALRRCVLAYVELVSVSSIQRPIIAVGLGLLCSSEMSLSQNGSSIFNFIFAFAGMILILGHIMVLNDYFDVEIDKEKDQSPTLTEISRRAAGVLAIIFLSLGLLIAWLVSTVYFTISLALVLLSAAYSAPPIRYKEKYPFSTVGEAIGAFLLFWAGYSLFSSLDVRAIVVSLIPFFLLLIGRLKHEIYYVNFDKLTGKKTLAVVHGVYKVRMLVRFCILSIIGLTISSFFVGWFSPVFLFFLFIFLGVIALNSISSSINGFWLKARFNYVWGFAYFFIIVFWVLSF